MTRRLLACPVLLLALQLAAYGEEKGKFQQPLLAQSPANVTGLRK